MGQVLTCDVIPKILKKANGEWLFAECHSKQTKNTHAYARLKGLQNACRSTKLVGKGPHWAPLCTDSKHVCTSDMESVWKVI